MPPFRAVLLFALPFAALAADSTTDPRLQEALRRYPAADANRDGVLTFEEAQAYAREVRGKKSPAANPATANASGTAAEDSGAARPGAQKPLPTHADVRYGPHDRNVLDLWLASSAAPAPLVVYIHGGGFVGGSKAGASAEMIKGCLDAGVSFMAINYRFLNAAPIQEILRDCARALQFVRAHAADYRIDPNRIAVYGGSAGAGTSLWLAFHDDLADPRSPDPVARQSTRVVAAGAINTQATYNLLRWRELLGDADRRFERPGEAAAFYHARSEDELATEPLRGVLADVDMLAHVSRDDPPVFLFTSHPDGEIRDRASLLHHPRHARAVRARCEEIGVPATLYFAQAEPRLGGNYQVALRQFLFEHLKVGKTDAR